jgi:hypothetical protein
MKQITALIIAALSLSSASLLLVGCGSETSSGTAAAPAPKPMTKKDLQAEAKRYLRDEAPKEPHP